ncbi:MAG: Ig-like domain-containing protein, partial [Myxococcota bacterium]
MLDISFDGARVFLAPGGPGAASEYSEIRIPQEFPALSAVVSQVAAPTSAESIAVQPGGTADSTAPILSAVRLDDGDGLLAVGAGDRISFIYSEPISNGELSSSLNANGSLTALVAQLGAFDTLGDLSASSAVLTVSDRTITITLGGSVSGSLTPGGQFTPLANSVDDSAGNRLVETTPVTVTGSFTGPFDPIYVASQGSDNSTIVVTFNVPMVDNVASRNPDNYRVSFDPGLELTVDTVTVVSGTRFEVTLNSPLFVGTRYTVSVQGSVIDQTNGLPANSERSVTSFIATDFDAPVFAGITSAVDAASVGPADGAVLLSWGAASDNDTPSESMTYRIFVSTEANDPFSLAFVDTVVGATNATVSGLISGQSYRFGVRAEDTAGNLESNTITVLASPSDGLPPTWDTSPGVLSVRNTFAGGTLAITYGRASDVSSNPTLGSLVRYNVYASSGIGSLYDSVYATIDELSEFEISGLTDGVPHFVAVRAVDAAGNEEQNTVTLTETPTFDVSPPTFSGISTAQDAGTDGRTVTVSWTEAVESNSPPIRYRLYFTAADPSADLPGLLFNEGAAPGLEPAAVVDNISGTSFNVGGLEPDTPYWFGVRARDGAFNFDTNTEFRVATPSFDTTPPLFSGVMNAQATGTLAQVQLSWDSAVEEKSPPVSFQMYYSDAEATLFDVVREVRSSSARQWVTPSLEPNVPHFFAVRACDARDNCDLNTTAQTATPLLDTEAPIFSGISVAQPGASNTVDLFWSAASEALSPPVVYEVYISANESTLFDQTPILATGATQTCSSGVSAQFCATDFAGAPLSNGTEYWFGVRAVDQVGNSTANLERDSAVPEDTVAPTVNALTVAPNPATAGDVLRINFEVSEELGADPAVEVETDSTGTVVLATRTQRTGFSYEYEYAVTGQEDEGDRTITIRAVDLANNSETATTQVLFDFTRDLTPPTVVFQSPKADDSLNSNRPTLTVDLEDPLGATAPSGIDCSTIELYLDNALRLQGCSPFDSISSTGWLQPNAEGADRLAFTPTEELSTGVHSLEVRVRDFDGNPAAPAVISFSVVPPNQLVINPASVQLTALESQEFTVSWDRDTQQCVWSSLAAGGPATPGTGPTTTYQPSTTTSPGSYELNVTCVDGAQTATASAAIQVLNLLSVAPFRPTVSPGDTITFRAVTDLSNGNFAWQLSGGGSLTPGPDDTEISFTAGLVPGNDYRITVTDTANNVTVSTPIQIVPDGFDVGQAIIIAGGAQSDHLWPDTRNLSQYAYEVLQSRGLSDDQIYFLSQPGVRDFDNDGIDEIDASATLNDIDGVEYALTTWTQQAQSDSPLFVYLVDHGGAGSMWLNDNNGSGLADSAEEILTVDMLRAHLDTLPDTRPITVFYEACKAGSFVAPLAGPNRVILTSAGNENATIAVDGNISLSQYFFSAIASGRSVGESLSLASAAMTVISPQVPRLDDDGDGAANGQADGLLADATYLGFPFAGDRLGLEIAALTAASADGGALETGGRARLEARVEGPSEITRVYALVVDPDYIPPPPTPPFETPELELDLPEIVLERDESTGLYVGFSDPVVLAGDYRFLVYASDVDERQALPRLATIAIENAGPQLVSSVPAN